MYPLRKSAIPFTKALPMYTLMKLETPLLTYLFTKLETPYNKESIDKIGNTFHLRPH